jgi:hypothetical protein
MTIACCVEIKNKKTICGCSLVVKPQPSKLMSWVRFPSPAPSQIIVMGATQCFVSKKNEALRFLFLFLCDYFIQVERLHLRHEFV